MIFVDTSAWFAASVPWDGRHAEAAAWLASCEEPLLTTDYVVDETLTLLRVRGEAGRSLRMGERFFDGTLGRVVRITDEDYAEAWNTFRRYSDKEWSFTDCVSKVVIGRLKITTAFAFDQHFSQFGTVTVVP